MDYGQYGGLALPRMTPAVKMLLIVNAGVFVLNMLVGFRLAAWLGLSWDNVLDGYGLGLLRLVTYQFVHSIDPLHLLFNMLLLYFFGTFVEGAISSQRFWRLYLTAGVVGGVVQIVLGAVAGSPAALTIGASGACYGVLIYAACMAPRMRVIMIVFPIELRWLVGILVGLGAYWTVLELTGQARTGTAHGGHLGGALWGFLAFRQPWESWAPLDRLRDWQRARRQQDAAERRRRLDELLDKVHREGIGSLTAAERRFLDRQSQEMRRK